jgi:glucans biosynthesis protein C
MRTGTRLIGPDLTGTTTRRHDIDWLRVIAVLLLFPFHTARVFNLSEQFYVKNGQLSAALSFIVKYLEPWHMPLFFLLAGASAWFALSRGGAGRFSSERVKRLLVPFLFGLLVLIPPQSYLGLLSHSGTAGSYVSWFPSFFRLNGADMDGYFLGGHTWGHLWFIIHLLVYSLIALPVMILLRRKPGQVLTGWLAKAVRVPGVIFLFALTLFPALFVPDMAGGNPLRYTVLLLLGYLLMSDVRFEQAIDRHKLVALILGPVVYLAFAYFNVTAWPALPALLGRTLDLYANVLAPWFFLVAILGYGRRFLSFTNRRLEYAAQASYPVYILHQTVIVAVAFFVVQWQTGPAAKFVAIVVLSLLTSLLVYDALVRRVNVLRFLFGMKMQKRQPPRPALEHPLPRSLGRAD